MEYTDNDRFVEAFEKFDQVESPEVIDKKIQSIKKHCDENLKDGNVLRTILGCVDLTSLKPTDSYESILSFVEKVNNYYGENQDIPKVAAICVYPCYAQLVNQSLEIDGIKLACVAAGFPSAQTFAEVKIAEVSLAIHQGAEEIDIVQPAGQVLSGDYEGITDVNDEIKSVCGEKTLKIIIETGALKTSENIRNASILAMFSGADFIKTSTGKEVEGATPMAVYEMCQCIKRYYELTGKKIGIKAAGGIRSVQDAVLYYTIVEDILGSEWLCSDLFRIGASSLANNLISAITGTEQKPF